jgi:hypothetical protein
MKNGPILALAVGVVFAIVALVVYSHHGTTPSDETEVASDARALRATAVSAGRLHGGSDSGDTHAGTTSGGPGKLGASDRPRGGDRPSSGSSAPSRPRLPEAIAGRSGADIEGVAGEHGTIEGEEVASNPSLTGHELPAARGGAAQGGAPQPGAEEQSDTMPENRPNVVYDGGDRVFDTNSRQQITDRRQISGDAGTISFWAQPQWENGNEDRASFVQIGENGLRLVKDGNFLRFEYTNAHGDNELGGIADVSNWPQGEWRYIAATWQNGALALYVDGQRMRLTTPSEPPPAQSDPRLYVGSVTADGMQAAPATLTNLEVAKIARKPIEIQAAAQKGPPQH